ncbi:type IV pilus assembly protein PilW [Methylophaga lonarensis MPL]|uniref:Type IV pilus assembly protein PilW n=1 Tax=Methylophaga lonarensis MPL TaxID=1286106 RepID=M7PV44_9GAMM|nr:PilW family protein [Methylophaga lonarensis]EMR14304.1 type IV pilus assembly protein PilW [Methylophaga lonarensis MPL]
MNGIKHLQKGLSLIELMVAIVIGLLLVAGVTQLFANNRQVYNVQDNRARMQENGRYALHALTEAIQRAGYIGCATRSGPNITNTLDSNPGFLEDFEISLQGNNASGPSNWTPSQDASISSPLSGNDIITVRTGIGSPIRVLDHDSSNQQIELGSNHGLAANDIVMVSDCLSAVILQIENVVGNNITYDADIDLQFDIPSAHITRLATRSLYIRTNPDGLPALYQRINNDAAQELVTGIENLQILFGEDTNQDGAANVYVSANTIGDWGDVVSVRVMLDATSIEDNVALQQRAEGDRRLSTSFQKTIALRNRLP